MIGAISSNTCLGGFTIFGVFLALAAWINGRSIKGLIHATTKEIG